MKFHLIQNKINKTIEDQKNFIQDYRNRLNKAKLNKIKFKNQPKDLAGRRAEYNASKDIMLKIKNSGWMVQNTIRIPDWKQHHRREIPFRWSNLSGLLPLGGSIPGWHRTNSR